MIAFEQLYFDLLNPSYNFIKQAGRNRSGIIYTEESKALMSKSSSPPGGIARGEKVKT